MTITRVNSASISGNGTTSATATIPGGTGILAGDLIIVNAGSQTGHTTNGISVQDAVNATPYTTILETELGSASTRWQQTFAFLTPVNIADGTVLTCTGYGTATNTEFSVDIFRGATATISRAAVGASNVSGTTSAAPALASAPPANDLVLTFCMAGSGTLTPAAPFTKGSSGTTGAATAIGYVLAADGSSTYGSTWTLGTANTSAAQTVSFAAAVVAAGSGAAIVIATPWSPARTSAIITSSFPLGNPAVATPQPIVTTPQFAWTPIPHNYLSASQPLGNPATGTPQPIVVTPPFTWPRPSSPQIQNAPATPTVTAANTPGPLVVTTPWRIAVQRPLIITNAPIGIPAQPTPKPLVAGPQFQWPQTYIAAITKAPAEPVLVAAYMPAYVGIDGAATGSSLDNQAAGSSLDGTGTPSGDLDNRTQAGSQDNTTTTSGNLG